MDIRNPHLRTLDEVELLLANARLRDELEPYRDESIDSSTGEMSLQVENEYLASMLAWERAPALPISDWFSPPLQMLPPEALGDEQLPSALRQQHGSWKATACSGFWTHFGAARRTCWRS